MRWDIFCKVIDNHGDLGVCWRLARQLAARGHAARLWVDDAGALAWMAPGALQGAFDGITVLPWTRPMAPAMLAALPPAEVWVEAFGCDIAPEFIAARASRAAAPPVWINLEYLSAEAYVERQHGLPSPVLHGPAAGWTKWFFYPGFTPRTGGLLREDDLAARQSAFDRADWFQTRGVASLPWNLNEPRSACAHPHIPSSFPRRRESSGASSNRLLEQAPLDSRLRGNDERKVVRVGSGAQAGNGGRCICLPPEGGARQSALRGNPGPDATLISLFCYEPPALREWLARLDAAPSAMHLLVTAGRASAAVRHAVSSENDPKRPAKTRNQLSISYLPYLAQTDYDHLLWACDLNFVRGEDSLVRALWAGQPFVWQIYPQHDGAHHAKLRAFLDWLNAPPSLRDFHEVWNGITAAALPAPDLPAWRECVQAARERLWRQDDLASQLVRFAVGKRG